LLLLEVGNLLVLLGELGFELLALVEGAVGFVLLEF